MYVCKIKDVDPKKGEYLLLSDLGSEGITVLGQFKDVGSAVLGMDDCYTNLSIVKLVNIQIETFD